MAQETILKKLVSPGFDCYCFLVDYNQMALPWPDGFQDPANRINGQAPIAVNDNYMFYAVDGEVVQMMFGQCMVRRQPLADTISFNRALLPVAIENEKLEQNHKSISALIKLLENMTRMKHGNEPFDGDQAMQNKTSLFAMAMFEELFSNLAANGHDYKSEPMGREENPGIHFPVKFCMTKNGLPTSIETILDDLTY